MPDPTPGPYSLFAPKGLHKYKAGKPLAQQIHETALSLFAKYSADQGALQTDETSVLVDRFCFALAIAQARAARTSERVDGERFADGAYYLLEDFEEEYGLTPDGDDTLGARRHELATAKRAARGNTRQEFEQQFRDLMGDDYAGLHLPEGAEVVLWPADLGDAPQLLAEATIDRKLIRITDVIIDGLGAPQAVHYTAIDPVIADGENHSLVVGDRLVIEPEHIARAEIVTVTAVGLDGSTPTFTATFDNPHEPNAWATQMPFPAWATFARHVFVALSAAAGIDPEKRREAHVLLRKILPSVCTWSVSPLSAPGQIGPLTLDDSVLGMLDANPLGVVTIP